MDEYQKQVAGLQAAQVIEALRRNNMDGYFVERAADVPEQVARLLHDGDTVAVGGSKTLTQTGVLDLLRSGRYRFIDRYAPDIPDMRKVFLDSFAADAYLSSVNAVTLNGELYNVDGNSNRVAAICYGPRSVILVAGVNKSSRISTRPSHASNAARPRLTPHASAATPIAPKLAPVWACGETWRPAAKPAPASAAPTWYPPTSGKKVVSRSSW